MVLESVPVRFLLGDGMPGELLSPNSVTLLPRVAWLKTSIQAFGIERRHHKHAGCHRTANNAWYKQKQNCSSSVLFQKWGNEGAQAKDSQLQGNLDALVCYSRNGKWGEHRPNTASPIDALWIQECIPDKGYHGGDQLPQMGKDWCTFLSLLSPVRHWGMENTALCPGTSARPESQDMWRRETQLSTVWDKRVVCCIKPEGWLVWYFFL